MEQELNEYNNCHNCEYGRRACANDMVACGFVFARDKMDHQKTMEDLNLETLHTGWGYMKRRVEDEKGEILGSGIMTNGVAIFDKNFCCKYYEIRKD